MFYVYNVLEFCETDIFVVVDKWKLNRRLYPGLTTEQIAVVALPDAAKAIFVTSITTSVAFFASGK